MTSRGFFGVFLDDDFLDESSFQPFNCPFRHIFLIRLQHYGNVGKTFSTKTKPTLPSPHGCKSDQEARQN